jgi:hypothetical protein
LIVIKESAEEIVGRETESALKKGGKHHNFISIGCRNIFTNGGAPLQHSVIWEKVIRNKLGRSLLRRGIEASEETEIARKKMRNGGSMRNG